MSKSLMQEGMSQADPYTYILDFFLGLSAQPISHNSFSDNCHVPKGEGLGHRNFAMRPYSPNTDLPYGLQNQEWACDPQRVNHILPIQDLTLGFKDVSHILWVTYERHVNFKGMEWPSFTTPRK